MSWTLDDMPDQGGRTAIVTGANTGIGYETGRALASKGARVILACRSRDRGQAAVPGTDEFGARAAGHEYSTPIRLMPRWTDGY